jgi:hypothetical protein
MKARLIVLFAAAAAVALGIGAYLVLRGGDDGSGSPYAKQLDALCLDARRQVEALGQPSTTPMSKIYPGTVNIGRAFLRDARKLQPPPESAGAAKTFLQQRALYYDGLAYAHQFLTVQKNQVAFVRIVNGALANLGKAEAAAEVLGAKQCMLRPFE